MDLITNELFIKKFEDLDKEGAVADEFIESEVNKRLHEKVAEVEVANKEIQRVKLDISITEIEKDELLRKKKIAEEEAEIFQKATNQLYKRIKSLEQDKSNSLQTDINFDALEKDSQNQKLTKENQKLLAEKKALEEILQNEKTIKIDKYKNKKLKKARRFFWILFVIGALLITGPTLYVLIKTSFNLKMASVEYDNLTKNFLFGPLMLVAYFCFTGWIFSNLNSLYHNHSNIKAFLDKVKIPDELK